MDAQSLVAAAVGMVAVYIQQIAAGVAGRLRESAIDSLHRMITERLRGTRAGAEALDELEANPSDPAKQAEAARVLHELLTAAEPGGLEDLRAAVSRVHIEQANMITGSGASGGAQVAVGPHGALTMPRGVIAGGDVNQSRVFQFRLGGLVALLAAVAIIAAAVSATTTYVVAVPDRDQDSADGRGADDDQAGDVDRPDTQAGETEPSVGAWPGPWPGDEVYRVGPEVTFTDSEGYQFTAASMGGGTTPQGPSGSAPPGFVFAYVVFYLRNDQVDRTADFWWWSWRVLVPAASGSDSFSCDEVVTGYCGRDAACEAIVQPNGESVDYVGFQRAMAAGATWRITCFNRDEVRQDIDPREIRLFGPGSPWQEVPRLSS